MEREFKLEAYDVKQKRLIFGFLRAYKDFMVDPNEQNTRVHKAHWEACTDAGLNSAICDIRDKLNPEYDGT